MHLNNNEIDALINKYKASTGLIDYASFVKNVNTVFSAEVNPTQVITEAKSGAVFSDDEKERMLALCAQLNETVKAKRIHLKPGFQDFDRSQSLHVTAHQFLRVLKNLGLMPPSQEDFDLITRRYCDRGTTAEINYFRFCQDLDRPEDIFPGYVPKNAPKPLVYTRGKPAPQQSPFFADATQNLDVVANRFSQPRVDLSCDPNDVEDRIRAAVVMKRIRCEEFFHDFDKLRKGRVTRPQFCSILSQLGFSLTNEELDCLANRYCTEDPERFVNYVNFCASINSAFTRTGIQKAPTTRVPAVTQNDTLLARRKYLQGDETDIEAILEEYRNAVATRRIHLKPVFQDFDHTRCGHVTKQQFLRVVDLLKISAPDHVTQAVLRRYMDKGNVDEVNYVDFCDQVDGSNALYGVGRDFNHSFAYFPKTQPRVSKAEIERNTPQDVEDVLARIRTKCAQQRIRIGEFFRDFDKLRTGAITAAQFRIGLNMSKCPISAPEFALLCSHFKAEKAGEHVQWRDFVDAVDQVFTKKGLEKSVDTVLGDANTATNYGRQQPTDAERAEVGQIVEAFKEVIRKNRLDAKSFFQDFDHHRHFKVTPKIFRQVLTTHGFPLSEAQVALVALVYGADSGEIKYDEFLRDCSVLKFEIYGPTTGAKSTYTAQFTNFDGASATEKLMQKIKECVKRERIRLLEFFQDHDILRKGVLPPQKFRSTLYGQKV